MAQPEPLLPWHVDVWDGLQARIQRRTLPHALLLSGLPGLGKRQLAQELAAALLCESPGAESRACGQCRSCRLLAQGAHPDFFTVAPEEPGRQLRVEQVRTLIERLSLHSQYGGYRIGTIEPAEQMNAAAANALLKTLEEPPASVLLVLVTARPALLPATIRSRCQRLILTPPSASIARQWLAAQAAPGAEGLLGLAGGAPLRAMELHAEQVQDTQAELLETLEQLQADRIGVVAAAAQWRETGRQLLSLLLLLCMDLARWQVAGEARYGNAERLRRLAAKLDPMRLHQYLEQIMELRRHQEHPLNEQLLLEDVFAGWQALVAGAPPSERRT